MVMEPLAQWGRLYAEHPVTVFLDEAMGAMTPQQESKPELFMSTVPIF